MNFQAVVTAVAGVHLLRGTATGWLGGIVEDIPLAVWAETNGPGDDIRIELAGGAIVEVQAKKGLGRGKHLWSALQALAEAIQNGTIAHGVLIVDPNTSRTIREDLSQDIRRLADARDDGLSDIGGEFKRRLEQERLTVPTVCENIRICVVHGLEADGVEIKAAKEVLRGVCADESDVNPAWNALYKDAHAIIQRRGRWHVSQLLKLFRSECIAIRDARLPAAIVAKLSEWNERSNSTFSITGIHKQLPLAALLPFKTVAVSHDQVVSGGDAPETDFKHYRSIGDRHALREVNIFDAEWTGRFYRKAVVVAGPGLGKSTLLRQLSCLYAQDRLPVIKVSLKSVAASMKAGVSFERSLYQWGLDGSGIRESDIQKLDLSEFVILADGYDECGDMRDTIASFLNQFSSGHPETRIVVTTRPIGYETGVLADWRHYVLLAPDSEKGSDNLCLLLSETADDEAIRKNALVIASKELEETSVSDAIVISPLMLGMAASVIVRHGALPGSRAKLFEKIVGLHEALPKQRASGEPETSTVLNRFLDILGWVQTSNPLSKADNIIQECAKYLATDLGLPPLEAVSRSEMALRFWENVGIVERLHHNDTVLLSFVHKMFAEFSAARFLTYLPQEARNLELKRIIDDPAWSEVIVFAGGLGLGDEIATLFSGQGEAETPGHLQRALKLLGDKDAEVSTSLSERLVEKAFAFVETEEEGLFDLGVALTDLAKAKPDLVGPIAAKRLNSDHYATKLVAWACALEAGNAYADCTAAPKVLRALLQNIRGWRSGSLLGGLVLSTGKDRDLIQRIAKKTLELLPVDEVEAFVEAELQHEVFGNWGFQSDIQELLRTRGVNTNWQPFALRKSKVSMLDLLKPPNEWDEAFRHMFLMLAESVSSGHTDASLAHQSFRRLQFSAFARLIGFYEAPVYDVHEWKADFDEDVIHEVLRTVVDLSELDPSALAIEASMIITQIEADPDVSLFDVADCSVDVPDPDWREVETVSPRKDRILKALGHGSTWFVTLAANILEYMPMDKREIVDLLNNSNGIGLAAAGHLANCHFPDASTELLLERLDGEWVSGTNYLFSALKDSKSERSDRLQVTLRKGLMASSVNIAMAAADLTVDLIKQGVLRQSMLLSEAFEYWQEHEEPSPKAGTIPHSPRETLLEGLLEMEAVSDEVAVNLLSDPRSDVRGLTEKYILDALPKSNSLWKQVFSAIQQRTLSARFVSDVLSLDVNLTQDELLELEQFLYDEEGKWRLVGMKLLSAEYMDDDQIKGHAERLLRDPEEEIRRAAKRVLRGSKKARDDA